MRFLFDDPAFSFQALRTAGHAAHGGADLGEVLAACQQIPDGDEEAWSRAWTAVAERLNRIADEALDAGHRVSAREAYLRASNYYRTADFFRVEDREADAESYRLAGNSRQTFARAAELFETPVLPLEIPYEDTTLPAYLFLADGTGSPRPTVIHHGGYDSTLEELHFMVGGGALRRGYHVLAFEGPGQQSVRREQGLVFRPDWEHVVAPVVDHALSRPDVDPEKLVLFGTSFGGLLAARAAAFEDRIAACVLHNGIYDFYELPLRAIPPFLGEWVTDGRDDVAGPALAVSMAQSTRVRWFLRHGMWAFGAKTPAEALRACAPYNLDNVAEHIACATLVLDAENDVICCGEAQRVHDALRCEKDLFTFTAAEGAGEHCQEGAALRFQQRVFDWLDERLGRA
ncbi:alpha/beta fold hydrolase [Streptomyces cupreus]|uniref:Alpha/beta fold hydrolase n=1 Tax=Streptomyces cupreus TaxID=2759956 RepID=A0A7X1J5W0_9ACTN|nr:alpha/beta fold hydrolase [Streptomyces cupreus]MBC2903722.1 alpha/beta fold hydrolase [Streptomyces cupreus]